MRTLLFVLGLVAVILGITLTMTSSVMGVISGTLSSVQEAVEVAVNAEELAVQACTEDEQLVKEQGASEYTIGTGYGRSVAYYCEDADGNRRDVTGEFVSNLTDSAFGSISSAFNLQFDFRLLLISLAGVVMMIVSRFLPRPAAVGGLAGMPGATVVRMGGQGAMDLNEVIRQAQAMKAQQPPSSVSAGGDLAARLKQIEDLKAQGLISAAEYDRLRKQILDSVG
jgi:hypothetical protein